MFSFVSVFLSSLSEFSSDSFRLFAGHHTKTPAFHLTLRLDPQRLRSNFQSEFVDALTQGRTGDAELFRGFKNVAIYCCDATLDHLAFDPF